MALSRQMATNIVNVVAADADCQRVIDNVLSHPGALPPLANPLGTNAGGLFEALDIAGSARNISMMVTGSQPGSDKFDELCCAGVAMVTVTAIHKALKAGKLPGVRNCSMAYRETGMFKVAHKATSVRMQDDSFYVFDWHATLNVGNPSINKQDLWLEGARGTHYKNFQGMN